MHGPDIIKPINDLATKVQSWSRGDDKKVLRLIQYIASTPHYRLVGTIQDKPEDLELRLFVDADFAGDKINSTLNLWWLSGFICLALVPSSRLRGLASAKRPLLDRPRKAK